MKRITLITFVLVLTIAAASWGFDGRRQGFVLGGGLGLGPIANTSLVDAEGSVDKAGLALNFLIGYAWDEQNMIVFLRDGVVFTVRGFLGEKVGFTQGFSGPAYYHYFGRPGRSGFINAGLGIQDYTSLDEDYLSDDIGVGLILGGGYEFTRHVQAYGNISFGRTSFRFVDYNHVQLTLGVAAVAF